LQYSCPVSGRNNAKAAAKVSGQQVSALTICFTFDPALCCMTAIRAMKAADLTFGEFRFDTANQCLWRGGEMIALTPKSFGVLQCLVAQPGQLITKDALLDAVWPDAAVTDASLKVCVQEIRRVLGDRVAEPRYIATVHGRGYRFIGELRTEVPGLRTEPPASPLSPQSPVRSPVVGRDDALATLRAALDRARAATRQVVFITGEAGIGKTTLVQAFLDRVAAPTGARQMRGRCLEHFGAGEAYLPLLDALGRFTRAAPAAVAVLRERAPTWLAQMPWLLAEGEREVVQQEMLGGTPARMLREITEVLEALAGDTPLVLVLEDLHWSDPSTLDALALLAHRPEAARLLVLATYRPIDAILSGHPVKALKQRLAVERQSAELALGFLTPADVDAYLAARLGGGVPAGLGEVLHRRTEGNPLFMVRVVDELLASRRLSSAAGGWTVGDGLNAVAAGVPESVRLLVERQCMRLGAEDVELLEAAALARAEFPAAMVAAALDADPLTVERRCDDLARQAQWVVPGGVAELADGGVSGCYRFTHGLYRSVLAERVTATRRMRLHQRLGEWLERAAGERAAAEMALHFEQARDAVRALRYRRAAARNASARAAHREAIAELGRALPLVEQLPEPARGAAQREILEQRGVTSRARGDVEAAVADFEGWAASARADGAVHDEVRALLALTGAWSLRDRARCLEFAEQAVARSGALPDVDLAAEARGVAAYWRGRVHGWRRDDEQASSEALAAARRGGRPGVIASYAGMHSLFANLRGDYAAAVRVADEGMVLAERGGDSFTLALCRFQQVWALQHGGEWGRLLHVLRDALQAAARNGHRLWSLVFSLLLGGWQSAAGLHGDALSRAQTCLAEARAAGHEYGIASGLLVCGWSSLGSGNAAAAQAAFDELAGRAARHPAAMEWLLRLPLQLGLSACALAIGDVRRADSDAVRAAALAAEPGEPTYLALAHRARSAAAMAARRWDDANAALAEARAVIERAHAPIAAWQVWETSAALATVTNDRAAAQDYDRRAAVVLEQLAGSFSGAAEPAAALGISIDAAQRSIGAQRL
jgi:DNA-binding winged helix-turn-helix (wHTH) protein